MTQTPNASPGDQPTEAFWASANPKARKASPEPPPRKKGSVLKKIVIFGGGTVVLLVVAFFAAGLSIAGSMAPGIIESSASKSISGTVKVQQTSFTWGGPQVIGPIELNAPNGDSIARIKIESSAGIWGLATGYLGGSLDAGEIALSGKAAIVRGADGQTNLEKAIAPPPGAASPPASPAGTPKDPGVIRMGDLPPIRAKLSVKDLDITYTDSSPSAQGGAAANTYVLKDFTASGTVDIAKDTGIKGVLQLSTKMGAASAPTGALDVAAKLDVPASAGSARLSDASVNAKVTITGAPVNVLDALALQKGRLLAGLGETADVELSAVGDMKNADATIIATSPKAAANMAFKIKDGVVTASKAGTLTAKGESIRAFVPAIDESLSKQTLVTLGQFPDVAIDLKSLTFTIPKDASKLDLRGTALDIGIKTTPMTGTVAIDPAAGAKPSAFTVSPIDLHVSTADLSTSAAITMSTTTTVDGKPGGNVNVDLTASNLLSAAGTMQPQLAAVQGTVNLEKLSTAIAQPFVQAMKIDLPRDVGPELDVKLTASATPGAAGTLPATNIDADVQSQSVRVKASMELADGIIKTRGDGITAVLATAGSMASRFVDASTGYALAPTGQANIRIRSLALPLPKADAPFDLGKLAADFDVALGGLTVSPVAATGRTAGAPIELRTLTTTGKLTPGGAPRITINGDLQHDRQPFTLAAAMELKGLLSTAGGKTELSPKTLRPQGSIELKNVPMSLVSAMPQAPVAPAAPGAAPAKAMDLAALLRGAVGPTANVKVDSTPRGEALDMVVAVTAQNLAADVSAVVEDRTLDLTKAQIISTIAPDTVQAIMDIAMPELVDRPRLAQTTRATVQVAPIRIPLTQSIFSGFKPDIANSPDATLTVLLPERTLVEGLAVKNADGTKRDLGAVGVESFQLTATFPPAALAGSDAKWTKQATANMQGRILSGPGEVLFTLAGNATAALSAAGRPGKTPVDRISASMKLQQIAVGSVERLAAQDAGFLTGAVGNTANVTLNMLLVAPPDASDLSSANVDLEAALDTPRLRIPDPVKLKVLPDRMAIGSPIKLTWDLDPAWVNRFMETGPQPGQAKSAAAARITKPMTMRASVTSLSIARGAGVGPLKPGIFGLEAAAEIPAVEMTASDGSTIALNATTFNVLAKGAAQGASEVIDVTLRLAGATVTKQGAAPAQAKDVAFALSLSKLADPNGVVQPDSATVDARGDLPVIPVALLDIFAKQDGLLTDALGPVAEAKIRATGLSRRGGTLDVEAKSARATAVVKGTVSGDVFVTTQPLNVTVTEVTPELTKRLLKGVPLIGSVEKTAKDRPAVVVGTDMRVPMNNDLSKLSGKLVVDPGEAKFAAGGDFGKILSALNQKAGGVAGRRLEPLTVDIAAGVATYQRWSLPLGEFQVQTEGKVDLVNKTLDVVTWLPMGALTDEASGLFKTGGGLSQLLGGKSDKDLSAATMVPWRTRGTFDRNKTEPDLELFAKEVVKKLKPEDLIKKGVEDLLKPKKSGGGK